MHENLSLGHSTISNLYNFIRVRSMPSEKEMKSMIREKVAQSPNIFGQSMKICFFGFIAFRMILSWWNYET